MNGVSKTVFKRLPIEFGKSLIGFSGNTKFVDFIRVKCRVEIIQVTKEDLERLIGEVIRKELSLFGRSLNWSFARKMLLLWQKYLPVLWQIKLLAELSLIFHKTEVARIT